MSTSEVDQWRALRHYIKVAWVEGDTPETFAPRLIATLIGAELELVRVPTYHKYNRDEWPDYLIPLGDGSPYDTRVGPE